MLIGGSIGALSSSRLGINRLISTIAGTVLGALFSKTLIYQRVLFTAEYLASDSLILITNKVKALLRSITGQLPSPFSLLNTRSKACLETALATISINDEKLKEYCHDISHYIVEGEIFNKDDWFIYALKGHRKGFLTSSQLATASHLDLYLSEINTHFTWDSPERYPTLTTLDNPNDLKDVLESVISSEPNSFEVDFSSLSPLEKLVIRVPVPQPKEDAKDVEKLYDALSNALTRFICKETREYLVLSPQAAQLIINELFPGTKITLCPTFSYSTKMEHFLGNPHMRVIGIESRLFPQPREIHHFERKSPYDMYMHDVGFHGVTTSADPMRHVEDKLAEFFWSKFKLNRADTLCQKAAIYFADRAFVYPSFYQRCGVSPIYEDELKLFKATQDDHDYFFYYLLSHIKTLITRPTELEGYIPLLIEFFDRESHLLPPRGPSRTIAARLPTDFLNRYYILS